MACNSTCWKISNFIYAHDNLRLITLQIYRASVYFEIIIKTHIWEQWEGGGRRERWPEKSGRRPAVRERKEWSQRDNKQGSGGCRSRRGSIRYGVGKIIIRAFLVFGSGISLEGLRTCPLQFERDLFLISLTKVLRIFFIYLLLKR